MYDGICYIVFFGTPQYINQIVLIMYGVLLVSKHKGKAYIWIKHMLCQELIYS